MERIFVTSEVRYWTHSLDYCQEGLAEEADGAVGEFDLEGGAVFGDADYLAGAENLVRHFGTNAKRVRIDGAVGSETVCHVGKFSTLSRTVGI